MLLHLIQAIRGAASGFAYLGWIAGFRLIALTLITYFLMSSNARFQEINDAFGSAEISLAALSVVTFVAFLRLLHPLVPTPLSEVVSLQKIKKRFFPGFGTGIVVASGFALAFLIGGIYRYIGFFVQAEEPPLALAGALLRVILVVAMVYCEEYLFRQRILGRLRKHMPDLVAAAASAVLFALAKSIQFDLGATQSLTLAMIGMLLAIRAMTEGDFVRGAGLWAGILIVFHPFLSLPIFGNEFQGIWMIKYEPTSFVDAGASQWISGGASGPLSSFALQLFLCWQILRLVHKNKNLLSKHGNSRLK